MVDIVYCMDIYKSVKISIGTVIKNRKLLKFFLDHLKTRKMYKHTVEKLHYLLKYVPDQYKTQQVCDKATLKNGGTLH